MIYLYNKYFVLGVIMELAIMISIESTALLFMLVFLTAYIVNRIAGSLKNDWFFFTLIFTIIGLVGDMGSWLCETAPSPAFVQYASNYVSIVASGFIVSAFTYYVIDMINENGKVSKTFAHIVAAANLAGIAVTTVAAFCGKLFTVYPNPSNPDIMYYIGEGFFYSLPMILSTLSIISLFVLVCRYRKSLGTSKVIVFSIYGLLPFVSAVLELIIYELQFAYLATCVSLVIVYIFMQSSHINELKLRESLLNEVSYIDQLTGLKNRRACDRDIELFDKNETIYVVFCDLNRLKKINDTEGHHAGDQFIITFTKIMMKFFPNDSIYRMSGDEFIAVTKDFKESDFNGCIVNFKNEIHENKDLAAIGSAAGKAGDVYKLVKEAETAMYEDKDEFYRQNPELQRK